ncbi:roadblock/LC7 domain-containing protein [bacterium]|nr:roadblock/LC7 domain-containing protein [bacterium]
MYNKTDLILYDEEYQRFKEVIDNFLSISGSKYVFLLSKSGQVLVESGQTEHLDVTSLASLIAGSVSATIGLAKIVGESEFSVLFHEGESSNIYISLLNDRLILVVLFSKTTSLGLVRLKVKTIQPSIQSIYQNLLKKMETHTSQSLLENISDDDIDKLFDF